MIEKLKTKIAIRIFDAVVSRVLKDAGWDQLPGDRWTGMLPSGTLLVTSRGDALHRHISSRPKPPTQKNQTS